MAMTIQYTRGVIVKRNNLPNTCRRQTGCVNLCFYTFNASPNVSTGYTAGYTVVNIV